MELLVELRRPHTATSSYVQSSNPAFDLTRPYWLRVDLEEEVSYHYYHQRDEYTED